MMEKIDVVAYSGQRVNERPIRFNYKGEEFRVKKILSRSLKESVPGQERRFHFQVLCQGGKVFSICYDTQQDQWFLEIEGKKQ